jgi:hypothetical protein
MYVHFVCRKNKVKLKVIDKYLKGRRIRRRIGVRG